MIELIVYISFFLFTWYSYKLIRDVRGVDQYWHVPQTFFLVLVYLLPFVLTYDFHYLIRMGFLGIQFPFLFNTGLNAYRREALTKANKNWFTHTGRYDFLTFTQTVILLIIGVLGLGLYHYIIWKGA